MAVTKTYDITLDIKQTNSIDLQGIVNGDTGNIFNITIQDNGNAVDLTGARIRFLVSNKEGISSQDSSLIGSDVYITQPLNGIVSIIVHTGMLADGINHGRLEIYTTTTEQYDTLVTTNVFNFECKVTYIVEKSAEFPTIIALEAQIQAAIAQLVNISSAYVDDDTGHLIIVLSNGTTVDAGEVGSPNDAVRYVAQTKSDVLKGVARTNIDAASASHSHGNITSAGAITGSVSQLVETDASGNIVATRKIVVGTTPPSQVTGLDEGDIYIYRSNSVNKVLEGNLTVGGGTITVGSTSMTEAQLQSLLALL